MDGQSIWVIQPDPPKVAPTLFHHDSHLGRLRNFLLPMLLYLPSVDSLATRVKQPDPEGPSENHSGGLWYHQFALFSLAS